MAENTRIAKWDNLKFILMYCVVLGHFMDYFDSSVPFIRGLNIFIYLFHMPAFLFLAGLFSKRTVNGRRYDRVIPYFFLYLFMKIFRYIVYSFSDNKVRNFSIFNGTGVPWFAMTLFFSYLITIALSRYSRRYVMIIVISVGIMIGYDRDLSDFMSGMRLFTMYPFFLAGYCTDLKKITVFAEKRAVRLASGIILAVAFAVCWIWQKGLYEYMDLLAGDTNYKKMKMIPYGGVCRGVYYLLAFLLVFCMVAVAPAAKCAITSWGARTIQVFALHLPIIKVLVQNFHLKEKIQAAIPVYGDYLILAVALVLTVILSAKWIKPFFDWLMYPKKAEA